MRPLDTASDAHDAQLAALRALGPTGRLELALRLADELRQFTLAGLMHRHPEFSDAELRQALSRITLGEEFRSKLP